METMDRDLESSTPPEATVSVAPVAPLPLSLGQSKARPLAVGDRVEWEYGSGTTHPDELWAIQDLLNDPCKEGVVTNVTSFGVEVKYGVGIYLHQLHHPKWGESLRLVRLSDGERF